MRKRWTRESKGHGTSKLQFQSKTLGGERDQNNVTSSSTTCREICEGLSLHENSMQMPGEKVVLSNPHTPARCYKKWVGNMFQCRGLKNFLGCLPPVLECQLKSKLSDSSSWKAADDVWGAWTPAMHAEPHGIPGFLLQPDPSLAVVDTWGINQDMGDIVRPPSLSFPPSFPSLCFSHSWKLHIYKHMYIFLRNRETWPNPKIKLQRLTLMELKQNKQTKQNPIWQRT